MPDNWTFVAAAYGLAALAFGGYWRWLTRKEHELAVLSRSRVDSTTRSRRSSVPSPPPPEPASRPSREP